MSKSGLVDAPGRMTAPGARKPGRSGAMAGTARAHAASLGTRLDEVQPGVEAVAFVAAEEERAVLRERAADRAAELVLLQLRLRQRR